MEYRPTGSPDAYADDPGAIENVLFSGDFPDCMRIRSGTQPIRRNVHVVAMHPEPFTPTSLRPGIDVHLTGIRISYPVDTVRKKIEPLSNSRACNLHAFYL